MCVCACVRVCVCACVCARACVRVFLRKSTTGSFSRSFKGKITIGDSAGDPKALNSLWNDHVTRGHLNALRNHLVNRPAQGIHELPTESHGEPHTEQPVECPCEWKCKISHELLVEYPAE